MITNKSQAQAIKFVLLLSFLYCFNYNSYSQVSPSTDNNWIPNTTKSDEFGGTTLDATKWYDISHPYLQATGYGSGWSGMYIFSNNRKWVSNGELVLDYQYFPGQTYEHRTGGIKSINFDFSYGYFEIYAKLPGYYENGVPIGRGFWPTFWLYFEQYNSGCMVKHDEIDILEPSGCDYYSANANGVGIWDEIDNPLDPLCKQPDKPFNLLKNNLPILFEGYHKYAAEWLQNRVVFYFDDVPFYSAYNHHAIPDVPMRVMIDLQLQPSVDYCWQQPLSMPQQMTVDYFRYYELNKDCNNDAFLLNNTQLNSFVFQVKRNITIGNGTTSIYFPPNTKKTLRFSNELTINGTFNVFLGSELNLIPTPCN